MLHEQALTTATANSTTGADWTASALTGTSVTYVNELGSTMKLQFGNNGVVTGTYTSKVSSGGGTISGPVAGWYQGLMIGWSVMWPTNPPALTVWVGEFIVPSYKIETLWYMGTQTATPGAPDQFWTAINAGADTFTPL
jgi:hypothetical protein